MCWKFENTMLVLQILLHDQGDVPQMKDQGFAVAPGTHTLVGVKQYRVTTLPDPYGDCEELHPVPVSRCLLNCITKIVVEHCGCHDVHMEPYRNSTCEKKECFV